MGMQCHTIVRMLYVISVLDLAALRQSCAIIIAALTKFFPLSEYTLEGHPRGETNRLKAARIAFEVNWDTAS